VAQVKIVWRDAQFMAGLMAEIQRRMLTVEALTVEYYREATARSYPPASLPGQFPHRRTGLLQRSLRSNVNRVSGNRVQLVLTNTAPYAGFLETGTSRMGARPHMRPVGAVAWRNAQRLFGTRAGVRVF